MQSDLFRKKWKDERDKWLEKKKKDKMTSVTCRHLVQETVATANEANQLTDVQKQIKKVKDLLHKLAVQKALLTPSSTKTLSHPTPAPESEEDFIDQQDSQELF